MNLRYDENVKKQLKSLVKNFGFDFTVGTTTIRDLYGNYTTLNQMPCDEFIYSHLNGNLSLVLPRFDYTKIFIIDLDCKDGDQEKTRKYLKEIVSTFGKPCLIEKSCKSNGGYHLYYYLDKSYKSYQESWWSLGKEFIEKNNMDSRVEFIYGKKRIRLPFSLDYCQYGIYNESCESYIQVLSFEDCLNIFENKDILNSYLVNTKELAKKINYNDNIVKSKNSVSYLVPTKENKSKEKENNNYYYTEGTRHVYQPKIIARTIAKGGDLDECVRQCINYNINSKDMQKWSTFSEIKKNIKSYYDFLGQRISINNNAEGKAHFNEDKKELFYDKSLFSNCLNKEEEENLRYSLDYFYQGRTGNSKTKFIQDCVTFYKIIYTLFQKQSKYSKEFYFLNGGVFLSQDQLALIKECKELNIKSNILRIYKFFRNNKILKIIKDSKTGISYCYATDKVHWAQHFVISSIQKLKSFCVAQIEKLKRVKNYIKNSVLIIENFNVVLENCFSRKNYIIDFYSHNLNLVT